MKSLSSICLNNDINLLNATLRYVKADTSIMSYAPSDRIAIVLFIDLNKLDMYSDYQKWTQLIIDGAIKYGGFYYLPYHLWATYQQFRIYYPNWKHFIEKKTTI